MIGERFATRRKGRIMPAWICGLAASTIWMVAWLLIPSYRWPEKPPTRAPSTPKYLFLNAPANRAEWLLRWLWSPTVFSLPSPVGFSRAVLGSRPHVETTLRAAFPPPLIHDFAADLNRVALEYVVELERKYRHPMIGDLHPRLDKVPETPAPRKPDFIVQWPPHWSDQHWIEKDLPTQLTRGAAWSATVVLEADAGGRVQHVFFEAPPADPNVRLALDRALRQWVMAKDAPERSVRVRFSFNPVNPQRVAE